MSCCCPPVLTLIRTHLRASPPPPPPRHHGPAPHQAPSQCLPPAGHAGQTTPHIKVRTQHPPSDAGRLSTDRYLWGCWLHIGSRWQLNNEHEHRSVCLLACWVLGRCRSPQHSGVIANYIGWRLCLLQRCRQAGMLSCYQARLLYSILVHVPASSASNPPPHCHAHAHHAPPREPPLQPHRLRHAIPATCTFEDDRSSNTAQNAPVGMLDNREFYCGTCSQSGGSTGTA